MDEHSADNSPEQVSMQVIADRAGVSRALVSMALRDSPRVALATRAKIQALARELNYRPNPMVRALMTGIRNRKRRSYRGTVAFITNLGSADRWRALHTYPEYFDGASERGKQLGYKVEHFWLGEHADNPERFVKILHSRGITGLIIAPLPQKNHRFDLDIRSFSAVTFGYSLEHPTITRVTGHHLQTIHGGLVELKRLGYRRIGFAISSYDIWQVNYLWAAGIEVARRNFPDLEFTLIPQDEWHEEGFRNWYRTQKPEVILAVNMEVWWWVQQLGVAVPDELGFMHLDCQQDDVLSGMCQKKHQLGVAAIETLANHLESNRLVGDVDPQVVMFYGNFNSGKTLRQLRL